LIRKPGVGSACQSDKLSGNVNRRCHLSGNCQDMSHSVIANSSELLTPVFSPGRIERSGKAAGGSRFLRCLMQVLRRRGLQATGISMLLVSGCAHFDPGAEPRSPEVPEPAVLQTEPDPGPLSLAVALDELERGRFEQARLTLASLVDADSGSRIAARLLDQLENPPEQLLPGPYVEVIVAPGESLSEISARELGDPLLFVALARLNAVDVPMRISAGTVLRVSRPETPMDGLETVVPDAEQESLPATEIARPVMPAEDARNELAAASTDLYRQAVVLREQGHRMAALETGRKAVVLQPESGPAVRLVAELESELTEELHTAGLTAWRNRDVDLAIRLWETLLASVPDFEPARVYLERAHELRRRLNDG